jgi:hypothetical protein
LSDQFHARFTIEAFPGEVLRKSLTQPEIKKENEDEGLNFGQSHNGVCVPSCRLHASHYRRSPHDGCPRRSDNLRWLRYSGSEMRTQLQKL